ncbi:type IV secretory system conjugative DNA transfer family protein [Paenarthrobacter sp. MSM-2-10-13]|uniref:type IV secretory system conjugative DNA transfer family protein n=1 Tax=Paenarthrobacter sp. MSM-2-10-13 TaxID=2717318 RepID=UPI00141E2888|nr:type IV secretory system conjugative DNA transfer family protein [Paenarthrobacter sp. MSM-2-10-13]NHW45984.1 type IV secretory system conjugative DNA transfer family protein [Paenarthrobacter sp. MSM-2-10-13]
MGLIKSQSEYDHERKAYIVRFPTDLPVENVYALLRVLNTTLPCQVMDTLVSRPSLVFEAWASGQGITFRLQVPWPYAVQVTSQIRHQIPGTVIEDDTTRPRKAWSYVDEIGISNKSRTLNVSNPSVIATDILSALAQALTGEETAVLQWVFAPAGYENKPSTEAPVLSTRHGVLSGLIGQQASREEIEDRRRKLDHERYLVVGRIAAKASTPARAKYLVDGLFKSLKSANSLATSFVARVPTGDIDDHCDAVNNAKTPWRFPAVLNVMELAAVAGFPLGSQSVPGLPKMQGRQFYATEEVARIGRVLGKSNYANSGRPIAQGYDQAILHSHIAGKSGTGKSVLLANSTAQDMAKGFGVVVIDASNSNSPETLFNRALNYVPRERLSDVVVMDVSNTRERPVGFNILDQGNPHMVVDQFSALIQQLYPDSKGVWTRELIHHGLYALIEYGNATLIDLLPLIRPRTPEETVWARSVVRSIKDRQIKFFMDDWFELKDEERRVRSQPLYDRLWQLSSRPEIYNILGQSKSGFNIRDVLLGNQILFINLAGLPEDTAGLLGTLIFQALWTEAQNLTPDKANFVYLDELQQMTKIDVGLHDILARGRKHKFTLTTSTQFLADSKQVDDATRSAILNNTGTKVLFESSGSEAKMWLKAVGTTHVTETDITGLQKYDAIAWIANEKGTGAPVTFTALEPFKSLGTAELAVKLSATKHGTPLDAVHRDIDQRRTARVDDTQKHPAMGRRKLNDDQQDAKVST